MYGMGQVSLNKGACRYSAHDSAVAPSHPGEQSHLSARLLSSYGAEGETTGPGRQLRRQILLLSSFTTFGNFSLSLLCLSFPLQKGFDPSTQEAEASRSLSSFQVNLVYRERPGQPSLHRKTVSKTKQNSLSTCPVTNNSCFLYGDI